MATLVLQAAGAFIGGLLGPVGATIGTAAGALAGYVVDRALFGGSQHYEGPRLSAARPFSGEEGAPLPRLYGTVRTGGTLIWATRFEETSTTERQGGKGGPKVTTYAYFANAAFAICEGEIAGVRRIWADGQEVDQSKVNIRIYRGTEDQLPDPLIEAKQGAGNAPAYRGTAYVVIDRMPIDDYGRRIPQLQFEVLRPVGALNGKIGSVALIPGSTEFGLSPDAVRIHERPGHHKVINRNTLVAESDFEASLDELQALLPNLKSISLVVSWFGTDLRAGNCQIKPMVTTHGGSAFPNHWGNIWSLMGVPSSFSSHLFGGGENERWRVSSLMRWNAPIVSFTENGAAYGGTPSDHTVVAAIRAIRARGLKVWLYPFIMMDVPAGNSLPSPDGAAHQPVYPWRGRITCYPGPGRPGSADKTAAAAAQVSALLGNAGTAEFAQAGDTVDFTGEPEDWGYRRFLLHYAHLAAVAGGVDGFLIGSELRGLTGLRDQNGQFPFVEGLKVMANEVRGLLGPQTTITYGADWTEYFGHRPADGSGDVLFHLDGLWADDAIDAVGIDNYMPLADWRDEDYAGDSPDGFSGPYDPTGLKANIAAGEGYDWYYASEADRNARLRTPITDGAHGKPWVFRYKDLVSWWSNQHFDRPGGVEQLSPTGWVPASKPIIFTELGCPAVDKGPNQPNVFPDAKSSENALPYFSNGGRSDLAQHRLLEAHYAYWAQTGSHNPVSPVYQGPMVDPKMFSLWAWDARPFPAFPNRGDIWGDGENWACGHWLNGRASSMTVGDLINAILKDHGLAPAETMHGDGAIAGYVVANPATARAAIEPIVDLFGIGAHERDGELVFRSLGAALKDAREVSELATEADGAVFERIREPDHALPAELHVDFRHEMRDHQAATTRAVHIGARGRRKHFLSFPGVLAAPEAERQAKDWLLRHWAAREEARFALPFSAGRVQPGSILRLPEVSGPTRYLVTEVEDGLFSSVKARRVHANPAPAARAASTPPADDGEQGESAAFALLLDLPWQPGTREAEEQFRVAVHATPWSSHVAFASPEESGFEMRSRIARRATIGFLREGLDVGVSGRLDRSRTITVELLSGALESVSPAQLVNGANAAAVFSGAGVWEVLQFTSAEEIEPSVWRLDGLLRGQLGTDDAMRAGAPEGAGFILLDQAVQAVGLRAAEIGLERHWRIGPAGEAFGSARFFQMRAAGGLRALMPLSPVHLRAREASSGAVVLSWIRRGRMDADSWLGDDVPLGETSERYRIDIAGDDGAPLRRVTSETADWTYTPEMRAADFPVAPSEIRFTVRQLSAQVGPGIPAAVSVAG
ncbi:baseplate multidomain protein megatron [Nitratireductor aquibiodomus]|uniref:baseplate multidomain protein megatron n=1 Tax=Nitratireductor aquibiodomus TaxID=204799 RepID=UPI00046A8E9C|nr:glycoside hydrolase/phage tail family protein [Nitratireductor aquibiodomus]